MLRTRLFTDRRISAIALPCLLALSACRMGEEPKPAAETKAAQEPPAPGFPGKLMKEALAELDLTAEQRAQVDGLVASTQEALGGTRTARAELLREVAASVRAGTPAEERIRAKVEALKASFEKVKPTLAENLNRLHDLLDASQRKALVTALRAKMEAHVKAHGGEGPEGPDGHHGMHGHRGPRMLKHLATMLGISSEQRQAFHDRIHAAFPGHGKRFHARKGEMKKRLEALAVEFQSESFDARKIELPGPHADHDALLDKAFGLGRSLVSLLTAEQRDRLATHLEERAKAIAEGTAEE